MLQCTETVHAVHYCIFFTFMTFSLSSPLRNCWTALTMTMNQKSEKKQRRMKCHRKPHCKLSIYYICLMS